MRYTGRIVTIRDHFGFISCQTLPTEADAVSRWEHKGAPSTAQGVPGAGEGAAGPQEEGGAAGEGDAVATAPGATESTEDGQQGHAQQQAVVVPEHPYTSGKKKKKQAKHHIFFSLAEVEGDAELRQGDDVDFVVGINKGERVARRVRFKSRPEALPKMLTPASTTGERRKLFLNVWGVG